MKNYLYSNLKDTDFTTKIIEKLKQMNVVGIIVDFEPSDTLCARLRAGGITENYYVLKLWRKETMEQIEVRVKKARECGFFGIAIDSEPYSIGEPPIPVDLWVNKDESYRLGRNLGKIIKDNFDGEPILYPEGILFDHMDKYMYWYQFYDGLFVAGLNPTIFMERCYNQWEPWNIWYFYLSVKRWASGKVVMGTWQTSFKERWKSWVQAKFSRLFGERFLYTEETEYPIDEFYSKIAR